MRTRHVVTTVAALTAGLTAVALHRRTDRPLPAAGADAVARLLAVPPVLDREGVVLPFVRPVPVVEQAAAEQDVPAQTGTVQAGAVQSAAPARCGDAGGRTKAGAPCAARPTNGGRCHHHPVAA